MAEKKISILGCGWLGLPLAEALIKQGYQVLGTTTTKEKIQRLAEKQISPFLLDLNNLEITPENKAFFESEVLIINVPPKRNSGNAYASQIRNLQKALKSSDIQKVIFVSSTGIYKSAMEAITEESLTDNENAPELIAAEKIIASTENSWKTTIIRFAGLFGPGREPGRFLAGKKNLPDPEAPVNLIHLYDCIGIIQEIIRQEMWNEIFNACADAHPTRENFYTAAASKLQLPAPEFVAKTVGKVPKKLISNKKLKSVLQYEFQFPDPLKAL